MEALMAEAARKKKSLTKAASTTGDSASSVASSSPYSSSSKKKKRKFVRNRDIRKVEEDEEDEKFRKNRAQNNLESKSSTNCAGNGDGNGDGDSTSAEAGAGDNDNDSKKRKLNDTTMSGGSSTENGTNKSASANAKSTNSSKIDDDKNQNRLRSKSMDDSLASLTPLDVTRRLRKLNQPSKLFGESEEERKLRLHNAVKNEVNEGEFKIEGGAGMRNVFLGDDGAADRDGHKEGTMAENKKGKDAFLSIDSIDKIEFDKLDDHELIYTFFKTLLKVWEGDLNKRSDSEKRTSQGKKNTLTQKQCKDYIRPLFKLCKSRELDAGLVANLVKIVGFCRLGEFVQANDSYINIAIGNAAWPIGVTQVGIHSRGGREKIGENKTAHVMNSELSRKYLTSVKRLMSFYQSKRDDVLPSKKVRF